MGHPGVGGSLGQHNLGSRQRAVESYIFGFQPRVQKGTSSRGGNPLDVKAQAHVSKVVEVLGEWAIETREGGYRLMSEAQKGGSLRSPIFRIACIKFTTSDSSPGPQMPLLASHW